MTTGSEDALALLRDRGFVQQVTDEALLHGALKTSNVTFYCGFDPTAASLHVGSLVPLMAMASLARAGHRPIAVLGGGTTMVGDPSGKTELRQMLTQEAIQANRRGLEEQVRRFVDKSSEALVLDNAEWLLELRYIDFLREIGRHFSVNRMLTADAYRTRMETGLSFIEFNYQLLQAYDFLVLNERYGCSLQVGGDDQWGNILAGTDLIRRVLHRDAFGLTFPLLTTAAGAKMGKTAKGAVWLAADRTSPFDFYQYFVNTDDRDVVRFLKLFTFLPLDEIERLAKLTGADIREAKHALAFATTAIVHGEDIAAREQRAARAGFVPIGGSAHGTSSASAALEGDSELPSYAIQASELQGGLKVVDVLVGSGLAASKSAARRLIEQGGVRLGDRKIVAIDEPINAADDGLLLRAGKKHLKRLVVQGG